MASNSTKDTYGIEPTRIERIEPKIRHAGATTEAEFRPGTAATKAGIRPEGATTNQPRAERSAALGGWTNHAGKP